MRTKLTAPAGLLTCLLFLIIQHASAQSGSVGIGTTTPNATSILDVSSTTKGVLLPRMTTAQRNAIASPATGLLIYQTDGTPGFYYYLSGWQPLSASLTGLANRSLSNLLAPTAVNADLLPSTTGARDLGSSTLGWKDLYIRGDVYVRGNKFIVDRDNSNNFFGTGSGNALANGATAGYFNTGIGAYSLYYDSTGYSNTAAGYASLNNNGAGFLNAAFGTQALSRNTTGSHNTATGASALYNNTTGANNTASGHQALFTNTVGNNNTATGFQALYSNTNAVYNNAYGYQALYNNYEGYENNALGSFALYNTSDGRDNTAAGHSALFSNNSGSYNTAVGAYALNSITGHFYNTAIGRQALSNNSGNENTACGESAGNNNTNQSSFLGSLATASSGVINATALGYLAQATASNMVKVGNTSITSIGGYVGWTTYPSDGRFKKNMKEDVPGLSFINELRPVTYNINVEEIDNTLNRIVAGPESKDAAALARRTSNASPQELKAKQEKAAITYTGFVAQEVEEAARKINYDFSGVDAPKNSNDFYGIRYGDFVVPLVKAVQELSKENMELKTRLAAMEEKLNKLVSIKN